MFSVHEKYMHRSLQLARLGAGTVAPNPMVGAVLVHDEVIVGEGYHKKYGEAHAEVNCINSVNEENKKLITKSALYVSLEPCVHYGKTPPCADLIIKNRIPKVVIGCRDIFEQVAGKGIEKLKAAGIEVTTGVLEKESVELNKRFFAFHQKQRPYIILKWAQSFDGKIASSSKSILNERTLISNEYTNRLVHKWRSEEAGIMIGTKTALQDNPLLATRLWNGKSPVRIVVDINLRLPSDLRIFDKKVKTIIFNKIKQEEEENLIYYKFEPENILQQMVNVLYRMNIQSVIVEGGAKLLQSFIDAGLWDEARIITNEQMLIGNGIHAPELQQSVLQKREQHFNDTITYLQNSLT
ncbi:MAG: bifunctional diaminohydroxyphosphoribosylaminopyrimidine deaminase/5-amino-6-(5-phosphoribosylamino)uracil reductase RibD [Ginsengibacter sp.]